MTPLRNAAQEIWQSDRSMRPVGDPDSGLPLDQQAPVVQDRYARKALARKVVDVANHCGEEAVFDALVAVEASCR